MSPNPCFVREEDRLATAALRMREANIGSVPVIDLRNRTTGLLTDRDITVRAVADGRSPLDLKVREVMTRDVISCREFDSIEHAVAQMTSCGVRRLMVLNAEQELVGMLSLSDLGTQVEDSELIGNTFRRLCLCHGALRSTRESSAASAGG